MNAIFMGAGYIALSAEYMLQRPTDLKIGTVKLVGTCTNRVLKVVLENNIFYHEISSVISPYIDGSACSRIVEFLKLSDD